MGERGELMLFLFPFLLACTFFAIAMSFFSREREMPFLIFVFTSVPLMFISGISWPSQQYRNIGCVWKVVSFHVRVERFQ